MLAPNPIASLPYELSCIFQTLLPPLTGENRSTLKALILDEGRCTAPVTVWAEKNLLIDGYTRHEIVQELRNEGHTIDDPQIHLKSFASESAAKIWAIKHQRGRRNGWTNYQEIRAIINDEPLMNEVSAAARARMTAGTRLTPGQTSDEGGKGRVDEIIGGMIGVSHQTVHEARVIAGDEGLDREVMRGTVTAHAAFSSVRAHHLREQEHADWQEALKQVPEYESAGTLLNSITKIDVFEGMKQLADGSVDLIFTSVPYPITSVIYPTPEPFYNGNYDDYLAKMLRLWKESSRVLPLGGRLIVNFDNVNIPAEERKDRRVRFDLRKDFANQMDTTDLDFWDEYVWSKQNAVGTRPAIGTKHDPAGHRVNNNTEYVCVWVKGGQRHTPRRNDLPKVKLIDFLTREQFQWSMQLWEISPQSRVKSRHRCSFPLELAARVIKLYTYRHDVVLDPFCGWGTTCIAAVENGRQYIGFDAAGTYVKRARERIEIAKQAVADLAANPPTKEVKQPSIKQIKNSGKFYCMNKSTNNTRRNERSTQRKTGSAAPREGGYDRQLRRANSTTGR